MIETRSTEEKAAMLERSLAEQREQLHSREAFVREMVEAEKKAASAREGDLMVGRGREGQRERRTGRQKGSQRVGLGDGEIG